jgi:hypothetical protein
MSTRDISNSLQAERRGTRVVAERRQRGAACQKDTSRPWALAGTSMTILNSRLKYATAPTYAAGTALPSGGEAATTSG